MPTRVLRHRSHTATGRPIVVRTFVRRGPEHSAKWKRLVRDLRDDGRVNSPEAVATWTLGAESFVGQARRDALFRDYSENKISIGEYLRRHNPRGGKSRRMRR